MHRTPESVLVSGILWMPIVGMLGYVIKEVGRKDEFALNLVDCKRISIVATVNTRLNHFHSTMLKCLNIYII